MAEKNGTLRAAGAQARRPRRHQRREPRRSGTSGTSRRSAAASHRAKRNAATLPRASASRRSAAGHRARDASPLTHLRRPLLEKRRDALAQNVHGVLTMHRQRVLADDACLHVVPSQNLIRGLLDELGLPLLHHQHRALAAAEPHPLLRHERIRHVQHVQRHAARAERVSASEQLQRPQHAVRQTHPAERCRYRQHRPRSSRSCRARRRTAAQPAGDARSSRAPAHTWTAAE